MNFKKIYFGCTASKKGKINRPRDIENKLMVPKGGVWKSESVKSLDRVWLFATPWTVPGSSVHGIF